MNAPQDAPTRPRSEWTEAELFEAGRQMARELPPLTSAEVDTLRVIFGTDR